MVLLGNGYHQQKHCVTVFYHDIQQNIRLSDILEAANPIFFKKPQRPVFDVPVFKYIFNAPITIIVNIIHLGALTMLHKLPYLL